MPRNCRACAHPDRAAIDEALVAGGSLRDIAGRFDLSKSAVERHKADHLPAKLAKAKEAEQVSQADDLLREVRALRSKAYSLLLAAEKSGDLRTALLGVREARGCLELLAKLLGELDERPQVNILLSAEWTSIRGAIVAALGPYGEARVAVAAALVAIEDGHARIG